MSTIISGNRGLPIILQGPLTPTILNSIKSTSFMELKPSARSTYPSYDPATWVFHESSQTSLRFGGTTYILQHIQLFTPTNTSYYKIPPIAEFALFYKPTAASNTNIVVTFIPIFEGSVSSMSSSQEEQSYLGAALSRDTSYKGSVAKLYSYKSIHYDTLIETASPADNGDRIIERLSVNVLVFIDGIAIDSPTNVLLKTAIQSHPLPSFGFPALLLPSMDYVTMNVPGTKPSFDESDGALRTVYTTLISTGSDTFAERWRYYTKTFTQSYAEKKKDATAYKCVAIDPSRDLKKMGDKYVVELNGTESEAQAQTLEDIATSTATANAASTAATTTASNTGEYVAIAVGSVAGITLASAALWGIFRFLVRSD